MGSDDFVAYDPISEILVVGVEGEEPVDLPEQLVRTDDYHPRENFECAAWLADSAALDSPLTEISLKTRWGTKASFELFDHDEQTIAFLHMEPSTFDGAGDTAYEFKCHLNQPKLDLSSQASVVLEDDVPLVTDAAKLPDGHVIKQGLRATIVK